MFVRRSSFVFVRRSSFVFVRRFEILLPLGCYGAMLREQASAPGGEACRAKCEQSYRR